MNQTTAHPGSMMRGHMALNSSPYKPSVNKLSSQFLIQDQMMSHYYNLATIKSATDSAPPKSTSLSIKKRDQVRRDAMLKKVYGETSPRRPGRVEPKGIAGDAPGKGGTSDRRSPMSGGRPGSSKSWAPTRDESATLRSHQSRPATALRPATSTGFKPTASTGYASSYRPRTTGHTSPRGVSTKANILELTYSGDYLERHKERFENGNDTPFTPRTKKRPGKSFLSQSKHYAAPLHPAKPKSACRKVRPSSSHGVTEENVKKITENAEPKRNDHHQRWIEEQSEFVQRLSLIEQEERTSRHSCASTAKSNTRRRIDEEEEELKYLEFVNDVTNDILSRGIYSDSVLNQVMERHVERRRHDLEVPKMWRMLDKLKVDLGMGRKKVDVGKTFAGRHEEPSGVHKDDAASGRFASGSQKRESLWTEAESKHPEQLASDPPLKMTPHFSSPLRTPLLSEHKELESIISEDAREPSLPRSSGQQPLDGGTPSLVSVSSIKSEESRRVASVAAGGDEEEPPLLSERDETNDSGSLLRNRANDGGKESPFKSMQEQSSPDVDPPQASTMEEESEYESVVALSTVIKPHDLRPLTPLLSESRAVVTSHSGSSKLVSRAEEDAGSYSDDFHEDSDDDF